ncbi:hypothetical protein EAI_11806 [Harpegnathos saltator]|uniref:Uncharacterized protein n=1 Tax=Harpegnathos saltator TaxID=610380 RepID=E2BQB3_HARSA|nr:hypothetical protein EAI_11806 [Harpegnathos saltator]
MNEKRRKSFDDDDAGEVGHGDNSDEDEDEDEDEEDDDDDDDEAIDISEVRLGLNRDLPGARLQRNTVVGRRGFDAKRERDTSGDSVLTEPFFSDSYQISSPTIANFPETCNYRAKNTRKVDLRLRLCPKTPPLARTSSEWLATAFKYTQKMTAADSKECHEVARKAAAKTMEPR